MEFTSQGSKDPIVHQHDQIHSEAIYPSVQTATINNYIDKIDITVIVALVCVIILMYLNMFYLSVKRRNESLLKNFHQTTEDPNRNDDESHMASKIHSENGGRDPKEYNASIRENTFKPRETVSESRDWVRPLGSLETFMLIGGYFGCINTIQGLRLSSSQPILPELVRHAITAVAQKCEVLQLSVSWNWLRPWFCQTRHVVVPFQVENGDVMTIYYKLLETRYDMHRGPLWRVQLVPLPQSCPGQHEAILIFSIHHIITDAFTNMIICKETLRVLNATMSGKVYQPATYAVLPSMSDELVTRRDWLHALKFAAYKICSPTIGNFNKHVYFNGILPQPQTKLAITKILNEEFTVEATQNLLQYCKEAGVTVHSCIMTIAKLAMFQLAKQHSGGALEMAKVKAMNCVNMRRYFPHEYHEATGCHISLEEQELVIHSDDFSSKEKFWSLVLRIHANIQESLTVDKNPINKTPAFLPCSLLIPYNYILTRFGWKNVNDNHIVSTNMGNLRDLLPCQYDGPVEITHLLRCVSDAFSGHPYTLIFHTLLDRFSMTIEYYTTKTTDEVATQFFSILINYISDLASFGTVGVGSDTSTNVFKKKFYENVSNEGSSVVTNDTVP